LHTALGRARVVAPPERICVVVAQQHQRWWQSLPQSIPGRNVIVQPRNRGTGNGILLPLLQILHRDADASLLVLPSDHYVRNEKVLGASLQHALAQVERRSDHIILLGFVPEEPDCELGYIVPMSGGAPDVRDVSQFMEKPSAATARQLMERGGLWNSFIFAAHGQTLVRAFEAHSPQIVSNMRRIIASPGGDAERHQALLALYEALPEIDFSRDIIERSPGQVQVLTVPSCGWSDLGTPRRVAEVIGRIRPAVAELEHERSHTHGFLNLTTRQLQMQPG
jgi:mannose-1-phosphate guanylyltransferase